MPKVMIFAEEKKFRPLKALVKGYVTVEEKTHTELAQILGAKDGRMMSPRLDSPQNMTASELSKLGKSLGIPIEDLRAAAIKYG